MAVPYLPLISSMVFLLRFKWALVPKLMLAIFFAPFTTSVVAASTVYSFCTPVWLAFLFAVFYRLVKCHRQHSFG